MHYYDFYQLCVASEIALPELPIWQGAESAPDVEIVCRRLPPLPADIRILSPFSCLECVDGDARCWSIINGIVNLRVQRGAIVEADVAADAAPEKVGRAVLRIALLYILHQRGLLPIHASAVAWNGRAILFFGRSGAGKSTLAAALADAGYTPLADDLCVVDASTPGACVVYPGFSGFRLSQADVDRIGFARLAPLGSVGPKGKTAFALSDNSILADRRVPLAAICHLEPAEDISLEPFPDEDAAKAVRRSIFGRRVSKALARCSASLGDASANLAGVAQFRLRRPVTLGSNILAALPHLKAAFDT